MASKMPEISQPPIPQFDRFAMIYPTPPPFSSHVHEKNSVMPKKAKSTHENKQVTFRRRLSLPSITLESSEEPP